MKKIILASTSPRRKQLLERIGLPFVVEAGDYEEDMTQELPPLELAKVLSRGKAEVVAKKHPNEEVLVIGADTFIALGNEVLGKPHTPEKAKEMLQKISGTAHSVITGMTIIDCAAGRTTSDAIEIKVYFKQMTDQEIDEYVATGEPLDKAAGYAGQEIGSLFIDKIEGDFSALVGLPIPTLYRRLKEFDIDVLTLRK